MRIRIGWRVCSNLIHDRCHGPSARTHAAQRQAEIVRLAQVERASTCEDGPDYSRKRLLPKDLVRVSRKGVLKNSEPTGSGGTAMEDDALIERLQGQ